MREEEIKNMKMPNPETIPCRKCKWGKICFFLDKACTEYASKPDSVYYDSEECPKFEISLGEQMKERKGNL